ncbi:nicotinic acid mononucleotide adenylyltransferase [Tamilnaduibacter salinus]|uniref:Probable nicotinate-nucleotide adenylyltransferase n=1 Tax=Tamilnaduibacter salinus TaxID=1484056 RepID=A0A2A2I3M6_9GAMM|nr:nicotinate-nucleotide adenylyltransferase [Tamilnaduibacter salinus]PAV26008.1 nicotinic acid mononucleotide adenylyltransferase [Tamilnaduibacter salinus]
MRVIVGGTFDPIHHGHLRMAIELRERLGLADVSLVPCHLPPHRGEPGASADQRLAMLNAAIRDEPGLTVDRRELARNRASYTVDTLASIRSEIGDDEPLAMVTGTDSFAAIDRWHQWSRLLELAHIIVVERPGHDIPAGSVADRLLADHRSVGADFLQRTPSGGVWSVSLPPLSISATDIRLALREGRSARYWLPDDVLALIQDQRLYSPSSDGGE